MLADYIFMKPPLWLILQQLLRQQSPKHGRQKRSQAHVFSHMPLALNAAVMFPTISSITITMAWYCCRQR